MIRFKGMSTNVHGVSNFKAPELLYDALQEDFLLEEHGNKPTTFSDVYSFGAVFYHVFRDSLFFEIFLMILSHRSVVVKFLSWELQTERAETIQTCLQGLRRDSILIMRIL
jgi:serine/threonine protein kinase